MLLYEVNVCESGGDGFGLAFRGWAGSDMISQFTYLSIHHILILHIKSLSAKRQSMLNSLSPSHSSGSGKRRGTFT